jgi:hypothetical protein
MRRSLLRIDSIDVILVCVLPQQCADGTVMVIPCEQERTADFNAKLRASVWSW